MSNNSSQRQTTFADIRDYELQGAAVMAQPAGAQRWGAIMELCQRIKDTEPQAFEVAADWIEGKLRDAPIVTYAEPFGEWWRRHYNLNPIRRAGWLRLEAILNDCEAVVSTYAPMAIGIYVALRAQVPATYAESQPAPQTTACADELLMVPYRQGDAGSGANSEYSVDGRLQTEQAKNLLSIIEGVTVRVYGKGEMQALNTETTPWSYASKGTLRYVAKCVGNILNIPEKWHVFMKATGAKNLQQCRGKEPKEVYEALKKEGYKEFDKE